MSVSQIVLGIITLIGYWALWQYAKWEDEHD